MFSKLGCNLAQNIETVISNHKNICTNHGIRDHTDQFLHGPDVEMIKQINVIQLVTCKLII